MSTPDFSHDPYAAAMYAATQEPDPVAEPEPQPAVVYDLDAEPAQPSTESATPSFVAEAEQIVVPAPAPELPVTPRHVDDEGEDDPSKAAGPEKARRSLITKAVVKRILERAETLHLADARTRSILSSVLGTSDDVAEMVAVIMSAPRTRVGILNSLAAIAADAIERPIDATVTAMSLDRRQSKRIWAVLVHLGAVDGVYPTREAAAAGRIVEAVSRLDDHALAFLDDIRELMKK